MRTVLTINAGSSSLKLGLWRGSQRLASAKAESLGKKAVLSLRVRDTERALRGAGGTHVEALRALLGPLQQVAQAQAVGHRVVHGGRKLSTPRRLDARVLAELRTLVPLAPLHLPSELLLIDAVKSVLPKLPQVVCFDTAFHRTLPAHARVLPLPKAMRVEGLRRYGFHGLSYESVVDRLSPRALRRAVICHLGSGSSVVAVRDGESVDTTMGFTPMGGIMMGTRPGDLDPGAILYWLREHPNHDALASALDGEAGLRGVAGTTGDMRRLLVRRDARAARAVTMYCYQVQKQIGAYVAALGGLDTLVFTGGIGERAAEVRARVCAPLGVLGVALDLRANRAHAASIGRGRVRVHVIEADEERVIAQHTLRVLR